MGNIKDRNLYIHTIFGAIKMNESEQYSPGPNPKDGSP